MENKPLGTGFKTFSRRKVYREKVVHFYSVCNEKMFFMSLIKRKFEKLLSPNCELDLRKVLI